MSNQLGQVDTCASHTVRPQARTHEIVERVVDASLLVYDLELQRVHILNQTAALIWRLCDGYRSTDDIAAVVAARFPEDQSVAERDVTELVQAMVDEQLLTA